MTLIHAAGPADAATPLPVRTIKTADLDWALAEGWRDFRERRGDILVLALLYPALGFVAAAAALDDRVLPLFFPLVAGVSILGPAVASGFYEIARRREAGQESGWNHFLDPLRGPARNGMIVLTLGLAALFGGWLLAASAVATATLGDLPPSSASAFLRTVLTTREGWTLIVVGNLVGLLFAAVTLALSLVAFPMVVDRSVGPVAGLLFVGSLPAFMGLAIVLPVLGYATWHLYTRMVER
jgi:uncharacterized membrane protein